MPSMVRPPPNFIHRASTAITAPSLRQLATFVPQPPIGPTHPVDYAATNAGQG